MKTSGEFTLILFLISYLFFRSRKRRTSETLIDDEETMTECSAAMLLMKLSCSPGSNPAMAAAMLLTNFENSGINGHSGSLPSYPNMPSPVDSSGKDLHVCNYEVSRKLKVHILKNKIYPNMPGYAWSWQDGKIEVWINGKKWTGWTFEQTQEREREQNESMPKITMLKRGWKNWTFWINQKSLDKGQNFNL